MSKLAGKDVLLKVSISAVYTTIAQVHDINPPQLELDPIDVTNRDSGGWLEFIGGLKNGGEVTFDILYDPDLATHGASTSGGMVTLLMAGALNNFQVVFPDPTPTIATFAALVNKFSPKAQLNDALRADVTLKVSGAITWA